MGKKTYNNPKRAKFNDKSINSLYSYYAGFSAEFVLEKIKSNNLSKNKVILDPWNGTGTTTSTSSTLGYNSIGVDLNPVMCVIAKAKLSEVNHINMIENIAITIADIKFQEVNPNDPLCNWFSDKSTSFIRGVEKYISSYFLNDYNAHDIMSPSQAVMY